MSAPAAIRDREEFVALAVEVITAWEMDFDRMATDLARELYDLMLVPEVRQ